MLREYSLEGKVAIVTGAGKGIGRGIALALAEAGADIVAVARTERDINGVAKEIKQLGRRCLAVPTDITKEDELHKMVERAISEFGKIDILVNNAAIITAVKPLVPLPHLGDRFADVMGQDEWSSSFGVDLHGAFLCTRAVGPYLIKQKSGKIINITSSHAIAGFDYNAAYCASKAAKMRFTQTLAKEWARYNINVNAIGPGLTHTAMTDEYIFANEKVRERHLSKIPLRRAGTPRDIGLLAVYLASDASNWMTGQSLYIDGGETIP
jgi:NAD(P)-dependent dehydrogenase (short-subunit alcohol dehydrogenase family)